MRFDAPRYERIVENGYTYSPEHGSNVAFFPAYPMVARVLRATLGMPTFVALLIVSNACLAGATFVFSRYLAVRRELDADGNPRADHGPPGSAISPATQFPATRGATSAYALWTFALLPTTFFFRMPYSEGMFVFVAIAALYAMERGWALPWTVALVGLATAVRPVGVALLFPLGWFVIMRSKAKRSCPSRRCHAVWAIVFGCWGLLAYMLFQYARFGDALAFAKTQTNWRIRADGGLSDKALSLASWEPIWSVYTPDSPGYFGGFANGEWLRSMRFFNPVFYCGTAALVVIGTVKRWLTNYEILLAAGLLVISYLTRAYEMCMESQARFAAVVLPAYIVLGILLSRLPRWLAFVILASSSLGLGYFTSQYAAGYNCF
jgi:hypothetical protein